MILKTQLLTGLFKKKHNYGAITKRLNNLNIIN